jgi:hypothetical protein
MNDGGRSPEIGMQTQVSNRLGSDEGVLLKKNAFQIFAALEKSNKSYDTLIMPAGLPPSRHLRWFCRQTHWVALEISTVPIY